MAALNPVFGTPALNVVISYALNCFLFSCQFALEMNNAYHNQLNDVNRSRNIVWAHRHGRVKTRSELFPKIVSLSNQPPADIPSHEIVIIIAIQYVTQLRIQLVYGERFWTDILSIHSYIYTLIVISNFRLQRGCTGRHQ